MNVAQRMAGKRICICMGSGGVGKTTTAAAVAMGLAARGQRVAVVTIDPARQLAGSLGLEQLGNEPRLVDSAHFAGDGAELRGELWAMMLDAKRTFDELIELLAPDAATCHEILANRVYEELSSAVAGSQEFTAVAKLYLRALAQRDAASVRRMSTELDDEHPILVPQLDRDVSDVAGLVAVERFLFAARPDRSALLAEQAF